jgi:hypothetical protein
MDQLTPTPAAADADFAAFVAIDWADTKHAVHMQRAGTTTVEKRQIEQTPESLSQRFHLLSLCACQQSLASIGVYSRLAIWVAALLPWAHSRFSFRISTAWLRINHLE